MSSKRREVGTLFGHTIVVDESLPENTFRLEPGRLVGNAQAVRTAFRPVTTPDDELPGYIDELLAQRPLLSYLAERKAALEGNAECARQMDDDVNLQRYRIEIADLDRYIESVKALIHLVARATPAADGNKQVLYEYDGPAYVRPMGRGIILSKGEEDGEDLADVLNTARSRAAKHPDGDVHLQIVVADEGADKE